MSLDLISYDTPEHTPIINLGYFFLLICLMLMWSAQLEELRRWEERVCMCMPALPPAPPPRPGPPHTPALVMGMPASRGVCEPADRDLHVVLKRPEHLLWAKWERKEHPGFPRSLMMARRASLRRPASPKKPGFEHRTRGQAAMSLLSGARRTSSWAFVHPCSRKSLFCYSQNLRLGTWGFIPGMRLV